MLNRDGFRKTVVDEVRKRLVDKIWFEGVCTDGLDSLYLRFQATVDRKDPEESKKVFDEAVDHCEAQTIYWDSPDSPLMGRP